MQNKEKLNYLKSKIKKLSQSKTMLPTSNK